jgi:serine protease Do
MQQKVLSLSILVFTLSVGILIGTLVNSSVAAKEQQHAPDATPLTVPPVQKLSNEFTEIARRAEPSVVFIKTEYGAKRTVSNNRQAPGADDEDGEEDQSLEMFRRFFGNPNGGGQRAVPMPRRQGSGSGFVVDRNGYIITNRHVVLNADTVLVRFPGEEQEYKAKVIGIDKETDVAVIKINANKGLQPMKIANSDGVQVGDWAIAIGAPFGLETSVTVGIVSAKGRDIGSEQFQRFIQTDAAINPGNSGGPLLNRNGEVIGINTMIATESGGYQGIGFALPVNMAAKVYNQIIQNGRVVRGSIGIKFSSRVKPETLKALGIESGVVVDFVQPGGPAAVAGIKKDDILLSMNGKPFRNGDDLVARVADMGPGEKAAILADRDGQRKEFQVTIQDRVKVFAEDRRINPDGVAPEPEEVPAAAGTAKFGVGIQNLTDADRGEMGIDDKRGVRVSNVQSDSFAEEIGIQTGDVIVSINRTPIFSIEDIRKVQNGLKPGDPVAFRVLRGLPGGFSTQGRRTNQWQPLYLSGTMPAQQ